MTLKLVLRRPCCRSSSARRGDGDSTAAVLGLDHATTFFTFVFFSLPVFWVAVILKAVGGISFNDWLRDGAGFPPW